MRITDLLEKLDEQHEEKSNHKFVIFGDFSGEIVDGDDKVLINFNDENEMNYRINDLWKSLDKQLEKVEI